MNGLSWLIYLIYVLPNFAGILLSLAIVAAIVFISSIIYRMIQGSTKNSYFESDTAYTSRLNKYEDDKPRIISLQKKIFAGFLAALFIWALIPAKQGLILIASSQVGEQVVKSETVKNVLDPSVELLQEWIKKELQNLKDKNKPKG